ncbi:Bud site selection protein 6 [Psilocybe cubensis]|uniref:Actin interacting protein 3 C-terminal domain-containing protein n=2 Tax=Psilocybe cubensis TaxID=181762 RepID=A0A8H8CI90_PSICU|nr:Bud site selection protein 6 [Psilocybe cubensis]KAH9479463.1 Bud site selection protein 6 [Psilocybe cubensis]
MSRSSQTNGHPSRRDNHSISSTTSGSGRNERGSRHPTSPAVETAVTRLLVSIKQLLEALTLWSQLRMDEEGVSNVYVRLGNDFNSAVAAFGSFNIEMNELLSVPDDLRTVLEQCLAEDATPENLELYLPSVRQIITNLLQGLRGKQSIYRRIVSDQRDRTSGADHDRTESRSSRSSRREGAHRSHGSRQITEEERGDAETASRRSGQSSNRRRDAASQGALSQQNTGNSDFVGGFAPSIAEHPVDRMEEVSETPASEYINAQRRSESRSAPSPIPSAPTSSSSTLTSSSNDKPQNSDRFSEPPQNPPISPPPQQAAVPASVKRYSLVDKPVDKPVNTAPNVVVEPSSPPLDQDETISPPPPETPPIDPPPAVAKSLAALKSDVHLERRASKRFSIYNITKMTGASTTRERSIRSAANHPNRRSAATGNLTLNDLAVLTEVDDEEPGASGKSENNVNRKPSRSNTPVPAVPPLPSTPSRSPEPTAVVADSSSGQNIPPSDPSKITIFLQLGREVKKVVIDQAISFASLRVLFVDKFSYNPGLDNFPAIYIRDPSSGVQYELEDTDDVKEKCLISLNIEPLDQIKQHIDAQISSLSHDIKELRSAVAANSNRQSAHLNDIILQPMAESTPAPNRPSDRQFQHIARRLSRFMGDTPPSFMSQMQTPPLPNSIQPMQSQMTGQSLQPQMTGGSVLSEYTSRVVTDLKTQFDEVQNLRRDLGIMRQLYTEFMKSTKESLNTLRTQTQSVKQLANTNVGGARAYIDSGKRKLDTRSQNVLTEVERLQDIIEGMKDDVIKRHVTPNTVFFRNIKKDMDNVSAELASLSEHINTVKPMWKKTWEEELQNIVEEQQFLTHQEEFLSDLQEDYKAMMEIYGHVEKVITLRKPNGPLSGKLRNRSFKPAPRDEGDGLSNVMLEIRTAAVDPDKRLKAIEASQRNREKNLAARSDELQMELQDFVSQKKLKMTGGAEEVERVRQKRSEMTLKAMFTGGSSRGDGSLSPSFGVVESP